MGARKSKPRHAASVAAPCAQTARKGDVYIPTYAAARRASSSWRRGRGSLTASEFGSVASETDTDTSFDDADWVADGRAPPLWYRRAFPVHACAGVGADGSPGGTVAGVTAAEMRAALYREDHMARTPLDVAAEAGNAAMCRRLSRLGAVVRGPGGPNTTTPLHRAARFGHARACAELIRLGADPAARDEDGHTAAVLAAARGGGHTSLHTYLWECEVECAPRRGRGRTCRRH